MKAASSVNAIKNKRAMLPTEEKCFQLCVVRTRTLVFRIRFYMPDRALK